MYAPNTNGIVSLRHTCITLAHRRSEARMSCNSNTTAFFPYTKHCKVGASDRHSYLMIHKYIEVTHIKAHIVLHINTSWLPDRNSQHPFYQTESFISTPALRGAQMSSVYGAMTPGVVITPSSISWPAIAAGTPTVTAIAECPPGLPYVSSVDVRIC